jgi:hypothetical protein
VGVLAALAFGKEVCKIPVDRLKAPKLVKARTFYALILA